MNEGFEIDVDLLADIAIDQLLPQNLIPVIYVFDEVVYQLMGEYRFVGIHLTDTYDFLSLKNNPLRNSPVKINSLVEKEGVEIHLTSYEVWHILKERNDDLCKILWMPTVHLDAQYSHIIDDMYDLIDGELAAEVIEEVETSAFILDEYPVADFNKIISILHTMNTGEYIWDPREIREYAISLNLYFNENEVGKSIASAINALELKARDIPRNQQVEESLDNKVRQVRQRLI